MHIAYLACEEAGVGTSEICGSAATSWPVLILVQPSQVPLTAALLSQGDSTDPRC